MEQAGTRGAQIRNALRIAAIISGGMLMILPAYVNQLLFGRLKLEIPVSLAINLQLFVLGIVLFIAAVGPSRLQRTLKSE